MHICFKMERHWGGVNESKSMIWNLPVMLCLRCGMNHFWRRAEPSLSPSAGIRTEQDLYVRLIDSMTKQVRGFCGDEAEWKCDFFSFFFFFYDHVSLRGPLALPNLLQTWCVLWAWHRRPSASALHSRLDKRPVLPVEYIYRRRKVEDMCPHTAASK